MHEKFHVENVGLQIHEEGIADNREARQNNLQENHLIRLNTISIAACTDAGKRYQSIRHKHHNFKCEQVTRKW